MSGGHGGSVEGGAGGSKGGVRKEKHIQSVSDCRWWPWGTQRTPDMQRLRRHSLCEFVVDGGADASKWVYVSGQVGAETLILMLGTSWNSVPMVDSREREQLPPLLAELRTIMACGQHSQAWWGSGRYGQDDCGLTGGAE